MKHASEPLDVVPRQRTADHLREGVADRIWMPYTLPLDDLDSPLVLKWPGEVFDGYSQNQASPDIS
jgi:hypothetical protein